MILVNPESRYQDILDKLGPCGLNCEKCFAFSKGPIKKHAAQLSKSLGNFDMYAQRFVTLLQEPIFEKYPDFKAMLEYFTSASCDGCRSEACRLFSGCKVKDCHVEKEVDFCFQCPEFPCNNTGFDQNLRIRMENINRRMQEVGVEQYYDETKDAPRY